MKGGFLTVMLLLAACAAQKPVTKGEPPSPEAKRTKLAVLGVDSHDFPKLANAINAYLRSVQPTGVDDLVISKVTLEVVQLSIECVEQSNDCFSAVGRSLPADRLLLTHIAKVPKKRSLKLTVTYFDVGAGQPLHAAERQFKNEDEAVRGMREVVGEALGNPAEKKDAMARTGERR